MIVFIIVLRGDYTCAAVHRTTPVLIQNVRQNHFYDVAKYEVQAKMGNTSAIHDDILPR